MSRTYTATVEIRGWKAHTCTGCGCQYAYWMYRKVAHGGVSPERAQAKAQRSADKRLAEDVDPRPCPACGLVQPDMVAQPRRRAHRWILLAAVIGMGAVLLTFLTDVLQTNQAAWAAMTVVGAVGVAGFFIDLRNPNRDREANRQRSLSEVAAGRVRILAAGTPLMPAAEADRPRTLGGFAWGLAALALVALAVPEAMRQQAGWPLNSAWYPPVVGPGDETYIYLPNSITSIKGYWTGHSQVTARDAANPAAAEFTVASSTKHAEWGNSISAKSSEKSNSQRLWVRLKLPDKAELAGKTLACKIRLSVNYPQAQNEAVFRRVTQNFEHVASICLSEPHAGRGYRHWWWASMAASCGFLLVSIFTRLASARALRRTAAPTEILAEAPPSNVTE